MAEPEASVRVSQGTDCQPKCDEQKASSRPIPSGPGHSTSGTTAANRAEPLVLKTDERLRLARERREEHERQFALRESAWMQREQRARQYYEKHLEERRRKLEEQRAREEQRRAAVEEKRRQKLEEEKARNEAVIRRTTERSQKAKQKPGRWSWGGTLHTNTVHSSDADRRSVSTVNLSKHAEPVITKRLSSSSATLLNTPDRAARRLPLSVWESTMVNRLLTPTHSYLARSRSAASLSGDSASCHPMSATSFKSLHCRSAERPRVPQSSSDAANRRRTTGTVSKQAKGKDCVRKSWSTLCIPTSATAKQSQSPASQRNRASTPSSVRVPSRPTQRPPTPKLLKSPGTPPSLSLSFGNLRPSRTVPKLQPSQEFVAPPQVPAVIIEPAPVTEPAAGMEPEPVKEPVTGIEPVPVEDPAPKDELISSTVPANAPAAHPARPLAGTTDPEEASRLLAEKRRQAREQREREEEERKRQEEAERRGREEMARRKAEERARRDEEERARREEEERMQQEERKRREEEEMKRAEEERAQREREEAERIQKQKEEEEARQREAEERERRFQKEEEERMQRKKRLEEIMKRTRKTDPPEKRSDSQRNGDLSESTNEMVPEQEVPVVNELQQEEATGVEPGDHKSTVLTTAAQSSLLTDAQLKENGIPIQNTAFEEVINLPVGTKLSQLDMKPEGGLLPVLAFGENVSLRPLTNTDEVQVLQSADVV